MGWEDSMVGRNVSVMVSLDGPPEQVFSADGPGVWHDPIAAANYVEAAYGGGEYVDRGTIELELYPSQYEIYVGAYDRTVICAVDVSAGVWQPGSELVDRMVAALPGSTCAMLFATESPESAFFFLYRDGDLVRHVAVMWDMAVEKGDRLPAEASLWASAPPPENGEVYPVPFRAEELALCLARSYMFGPAFELGRKGYGLPALPLQRFVPRKRRKRRGFFAGFRA